MVLMNFLDNIRHALHSGDDKETAALKACLLHFSHGQVKCDGCGTLTSLETFQPLTMGTCPKCGVLIFIPVDLDGWVVCKPVGVGGQASVYVACKPDDPRNKVAVKILWKQSETPAGAVEDFLREAAIGKSFGSHPNLMQVHDYGYLDDGAFIITQFVEGTSIYDALADCPNGLQPELCLYYALDVIEGLRHIHECGYIYRDLTPRNIIIGPDGIARLIDFGLCKTHDDAWEGRPATVLGTPMFVSPERLRREGEDLRSDIYSLGMVLFLALTGKPYFPPTEQRTVVKDHLRFVRVPTAVKMKGFDDAIVSMVDGMIKQEVEARFQNYDEIRNAIQPILEKFAQVTTKDPILKLRRKGK